MTGLEKADSQDRSPDADGWAGTQSVTAIKTRVAITAMFTATISNTGNV